MIGNDLVGSLPKLIKDASKSTTSSEYSIDDFITRLYTIINMRNYCFSKKDRVSFPSLLSFLISFLNSTFGHLLQEFVFIFRNDFYMYYFI